LSVSELLAVDVQFFVARQDGAPAGCGAVKRFGGEYAEVKRMYVRPAFRGRGLGRAILERLERVMQEQNIPLLRLETGIHQIEAIGLYERFGFYEIAPFGDYLPDPLSRFFEKRLSAI
jgi:ribosomal protein S18 acetylase RimI-like enzyme